MTSSPEPGPQQTSPGTGSGPRETDEDLPLFDTKLIRNQAGYVRGSLKRHKRLVIGIIVAVVGLTATALATLPKTYHVDTVLLAQRNLVINKLGNPRRALTEGADNPTRAAAETIMRRDNLVALVKQTELLANWDQTRAPALRLKDTIMKFLRGQANDEDRMDSLVQILEKKLQVKTEGDTVQIAVDWSDPQAALQLVSAAQQNFLEARHLAEISIITEALSILNGHALQEQQEIEQMIDEIQRARQAKAAQEGLEPAHRVVVPRAPRPPVVDQETAQLKILLLAKRRSIADLEDSRRHHLGELQSQLAQQRAIYSETHPVVVDTQQSIALLSQESPQLQQLRREESALAVDYERKTGKPLRTGNETEVQHVLLPPEVQTLRREQPGENDDPGWEFARARMKFALSNFESLRERIDGARIELDAARAAFKYRYTVVRPPLLPKGPTKPNAQLMMLGSVIAAVILAALAATLVDVHSGRLHQRWQVERALDLPVLAEVQKR